MIHNWHPDVAVRPRTGVIVEENGLYLSNYALMKPVGSLQMNPTAICAGDNSIVRFNSIMVAPTGSNLDIGSRTILNGKGCRTEVISRAITTGGNIIARGYIEGNAPDVKGHLECRGLIMGSGGSIYAIPELKGNLAGIDLSHEAAVGKIAEEEVGIFDGARVDQDGSHCYDCARFPESGYRRLTADAQSELKKAVEASEKDLM